MLDRDGVVTAEWARELVQDAYVYASGGKRRPKQLRNNRNKLSRSVQVDNCFLRPGQAGVFNGYIQSHLPDGVRCMIKQRKRGRAYILVQFKSR